MTMFAAGATFGAVVLTVMNAFYRKFRVKGRMLRVEVPYNTMPEHYAIADQMNDVENIVRGQATRVGIRVTGTRYYADNQHQVAVLYVTYNGGRGERKFLVRTVNQLGKKGVLSELLI